MKRDDSNNMDATIDSHLGLYEASSDQLEASGERIRQRVQAELANSPVIATESRAQRPWLGRVWRVALQAAGAMVIVLSVTYVLLDRANPSAVVTDGPLYRISGKDSKLVEIGQNVKLGDILRAGGSQSAVLTLADDTRVEMRAQSELSLERAEDGVRIRLKRGSILVNAAEQRNGHLYVQTQDVTVSVVGTVFLVNAEEAGSRVAVIEGEVHVQQGVLSHELLSGEQTVTNAGMEPRPVKSEITWSRNAETHIALLQQSAPPPMAVAAKQLKFEVVSIKPEPPSTRPEDVGPGGGSIDCVGVDGRFGSRNSQGAGLGRCAGRHVSLMWLIDTAYGLEGRAPGRILQTGYSKPNPGPGFQFEPWIGDLFGYGYQIEARAENPATTTRDQLQQMLQAMLADRFKLRIRRETREVDALVLSLGKAEHKLRETRVESAVIQRQSVVEGVRKIEVTGNGRMQDFIDAQADFFSIVDKTGLQGIYAFNLAYSVPVPLPRENGAGRGGGGASQGSPWLTALQDAIQDQLGLRLENAKAPADFIMIDHVEKPSEN